MNDFAVSEALCAADAVDVLEREPQVDIVVTDVQMPGAMEGRPLARFVRDRWPPTIFVIASGAETVLERELPTRGVFLAKPFSSGRLLATIERFTAAAE